MRARRFTLITRQGAGHDTQNDQPRGPVSEQQVWTLAYHGELQPDDLIWYEGLADWIPAERVPGLFPPERLTQTAFAPPPADNPNPYQAPVCSGDVEQHAPLSCPICGELTNSLKQYRAVDLCIFLCAWLYWQDVIIRACPKCMRRFLWKQCLLNVIPANLLWFILILPLTLGLVLDTHRRGHSGAALRTPAMVAARERARRARQESAWGRVLTALAWFIRFILPLTLFEPDTHRRGHSDAELATLAMEAAARERTRRAREELVWGWVLTAFAGLLFWLPLIGLAFAGMAWLVNRPSRPSGRYRASQFALLGAGILHVALIALIVAAALGVRF